MLLLMFCRRVLSGCPSFLRRSVPLRSGVLSGRVRLSPSIFRRTGVMHLRPLLRSLMVRRSRSMGSFAVRRGCAMEWLRRLPLLRSLMVR